MAKKGQIFKAYSPDFKVKAVQMYKSGMSMREIAMHLGLPNHSYIVRWVRDYEKNGEAGLTNNRKGQQGSINLGKRSSKRPDLIIKWLEAEIALLKKITAWERGNARKRFCFPLLKN